MANKKYFTDESLSALVDNAKSYTDTSVANRATANHGIYYGTCETAGSVKNKVVTLKDATGFSLEEGTVVVVKFKYSCQVSSPNMNVNHTGLIPMVMHNTIDMGADSSTNGWQLGAVQMFVYDGTSWVRDYWYNSKITNSTLGHGYGTCDTEEETTTKVIDCTGHVAKSGGFLSVKFTNAVPANSNFSFNTSATTYNVYYNGGTLTDGLIEAGETATFVCDGTDYHLVAVNRDSYSKVEIDSIISNLGQAKNVWYGTCPTAAATTEKVVTTTSSDFKLEDGSIVYVFFTYASCANATLNIDGKGAINIKTVGDNNMSAYYWAGREVVGFVYDGTCFRMLEGQAATTTYYGVTKLSTSTSSSSTSVAATPSAVKAAYELAESKQSPATTLEGYGITDAYTKTDHEWRMIYDSGETTEYINSFANIDISGYKKLMVAIKNPNDGSNAATSKYGSAIFTATNGTTYQMPVFNTLFMASDTTTAQLGFFEFADGWLICPQVVRSIRYPDYLTDVEGGTCTNMNSMGSALMKCTNTLSTLTISSLDQDAEYFFGVGSRLIVWGCNA